MMVAGSRDRVIPFFICDLLTSKHFTTVFFYPRKNSRDSLNDRGKKAQAFPIRDEFKKKKKKKPAICDVSGTSLLINNVQMVG